MNGTISKRWVSNRIKQGKILVKCCFSLTDDYAFDNANKFGKAEIFLPAYFGKCGEYKSSGVKFYNSDNFKCYGDREGIFRIRIHSNLVYDARLRGKDGN